MNPFLAFLTITVVVVSAWFVVVSIGWLQNMNLFHSIESIQIGAQPNIILAPGSKLFETLEEMSTETYQDTNSMGKVRIVKYYDPALASNCWLLCSTSLLAIKESLHTHYLTNWSYCEKEGKKQSDGIVSDNESNTDDKLHVVIVSDYPHWKRFFGLYRVMLNGLCTKGLIKV